MDHFKLKVSKIALRSFTNDDLATQVEMSLERGMGTEWKRAVMEEASERLRNPPKPARRTKVTNG